jgi:hypothetical protein
VDGTLSPDGKWVIHGMNWVPAMLSPDGRHYAHEKKWYPILQTSLDAGQEDSIYVTKHELNYTRANYLSLAMLVLGGIALYETLNPSIINLERASELSRFSYWDDVSAKEFIAIRYGYAFALGTISALICLVGLLSSRTGKLGIRTAKISSLAGGLFFLLPYLRDIVWILLLRYKSGSIAVGFMGVEFGYYLGSFSPSIFAGVIGVMLHIYCRRKLS